MLSVLLFYVTLMINILPKMVINGKIVREEPVNSSKSSSRYWHNLKRNM